MKTIIRTLVFSGALLFSQAHADSSFATAGSFLDLRAAVMQLDVAQRKQVLIVMDDDDTLTTMPCVDRGDPMTCQYLGSAVWYQWQSDLLDTQERGVVASDVEGLLDVTRFLFGLGYMDYTEPAVPTVLSELADSGAKLLILTARESADQSATEIQLEYRQLASGEAFLDLIRNNALNGRQSGMPSLAGPFLPVNCNIDPPLSTNPRPVAYQQGVMYVAGQNKGAMLQCLLDRTDSDEIRYVFFLDDTEKNARDVAAAFRHNSGQLLQAFHYTQMDVHKEAFLHGPQAGALQNRAQSSWHAIEQSVREGLLAPTLPPPVR